MILKELQMDLPFVYNDDIPNYESVKIYQNTWKDKRRQFQLMCRCMTSMLERLMPKIITEDYWKIIIECVEKKTKSEGLYLPEILFVQVLFDIDSFYNMDDYGKKKYIINKVLETVDYLSDNGYPELEELKQTCDIIIKSDYVNQWLWKKPVRFENKSVQIKVLHEVDRVGIYMVFNDGNSNNEELLLVEDVPDEWIYNKYLGKLEWISEKKAQLTAKDGTIFYGEII